MMTIDRRTLILALAALLASPSAAAAQAPELAVGQEWSVKGTTAKVVIGRIDFLGGSEVLSVSILDVPTEHGPTSFGHAPFAAPALVASLDRILANGVATDPHFEEGYQQWKSARGGYFTISVAQMIAAVLSTIPRPLGRPPPAQPPT